MHACKFAISVAFAKYEVIIIIMLHFEGLTKVQHHYSNRNAFQVFFG